MRILLVTRGVFTNVLGTPKVHWDLKEAYEAMGHSVDVLDYSVVYPNGQSRFSQIFGRLYTYEYLDFLKRNASKYDVIDANYEAITFPKSTYNFKGLVMGRSHGLPPIYKEAETKGRFAEVMAANNQGGGLKTMVGNWYRSLLKGPTMKEFIESVDSADVLHCLSRAEQDYFISYGIAPSRIKLIPNGLPDRDIANLNKAELSVKSNAIAFVGSWTMRKGIKDMDKLLQLVNQSVRVDSFDILGGHYDAETVKSDFEPERHPFLNIVPRFKPEELPFLLKKARVGVFPSYIEGFGLAVVEQLACGMPVVAFNVPGPADILAAVDKTLLIEPGNIEAFAQKVVELLQMPPDAYQALSDKCKAASHRYRLSKVAKEFIDVYIEGLETIKSK